MYVVQTRRYKEFKRTRTVNKRKVNEGERPWHAALGEQGPRKGYDVRACVRTGTRQIQRTRVQSGCVPCACAGADVCVSWPVWSGNHQFLSFSQPVWSGNVKFYVSTGPPGREMFICMCELARVVGARVIFMCQPARLVGKCLILCVSWPVWSGNG